MKSKRNYKMLIAICAVLLFSVVVTDTSLLKLVGDIGGGFLPKATRLITMFGY